MPFVQEPWSALEARVAEFRNWLGARPETSIAVVARSTFLRAMTGKRFANAQRIVLDL